MGVVCRVKIHVDIGHGMNFFKFRCWDDERKNSDLEKDIRIGIIRLRFDK